MRRPALGRDRARDGCVAPLAPESCAPLSAAAVFGKEFQASPAGKALAEEHKKATGSDKLARGGYPDMGHGKYADALPYADWLLLANAQRAHGNYVEGFGSVVTLALVSGLKYPVPTAVGCAVYALGREIFNQVYCDVSMGADYRMRGAAILDIALVGLLGGAVASAGAIAKLW